MFIPFYRYIMQSYFLPVLSIFVGGLLYVVYRVFFCNSSRPVSRLPLKPLCDFPNCVRCNRNQTTLEQARLVFDDSYALDCGVRRVDDAFELAVNQKNRLHLFHLPSMTEKEFWDERSLPPRYCQDLKLLQDRWNDILDEYLSLSVSEEGWQFNSAASGRKDWRVFNLISQGQTILDSRSKCFKTWSVLNQMQNLMRSCAFGYVFFSVLPPGTEVEPHRGPTNTRLRVHLALNVPSLEVDCSLQVGGSNRRWKVGKCLVFDDSLPHSVTFAAHTDNSHREVLESRVVLLLDLWHPDLTANERKCLADCFGVLEQT